ncbi:MAG: hypothetical protein IPK16_01660 [Anaerolineales bacterium]|nr:hypothetical protein [Anaerolineales bacterium]
MDQFPACDLFCLHEPSALTLLWEQIDQGNALDAQLYASVLASFTRCTLDEVSRALQGMARPPKPVLSAVLVATGLRSGFAAKLALLDLPNLHAEQSRWAFFTPHVPALVPNEPSSMTIFVAIGNHQQARIAAGKHYARMLELLLVDTQSRYTFTYAFAACRSGSEEADARARTVEVFRQSLSERYLPPNASVELLADLQTDVALPNVKGLSIILALHAICATKAGADLMLLSEFNDSASWLNVFHMIEALTKDSRQPHMVSGRRPDHGAGKGAAGHVQTRLFNVLFRTLIPLVTVRDSSAVLKLAQINTWRAPLGSVVLP